MIKNVCGLDKVIRLLLGIILISWILLDDGPIWAWVGVVALGTGAVSFCPLYTLAGLSTCQKKVDSNSAEQG